jgi:hypothetical protein
MKVEQK